MILFLDRYYKLMRQTSFVFLMLGSMSCYGQLGNLFNDTIAVISKTTTSGPGSSVRCGLRDHTGDLWFGSWDGIFRYNGSSFTVYRQAMTEFLAVDTKNAYLNRVYCLFEDRAGIMWFGTQGGVLRYDGKEFMSFPLPEADSKFIEYAGADLSTKSVLTIFQDTAGVIWFGTQGSGVYRYDGKSVTSFTEKDGLCNNCVQSIAEDRNGNLLFGTRGGGLCSYNTGGFSEFAVSDIGKIDHIFSMIKDRKRNLWMSFTRGSTRKYDGSVFTTLTDEGHGFTSFFLEDQQGRLWLGNNRTEIRLYDGKSFTDFPFNEELRNQLVWFILEDVAGNFWFGTKTGLYKYDGETFKAVFGL